MKRDEQRMIEITLRQPETGERNLSAVWWQAMKGSAALLAGRAVAPECFLTCLTNGGRRISVGVAGGGRRLPYLTRLARSQIGSASRRGTRALEAVPSRLQTRLEPLIHTTTLATRPARPPSHDDIAGRSACCACTADAASIFPGRSR